MLTWEIYYQTVREVFDPLFIEELKFEFAKRAYSKDLKTRVRQTFAFHLEKERGETFHVLLGLNSPLLRDQLPVDESGNAFVQFVTKIGISEFPRKWPCHNERTLRHSLAKIEGMLGKVILPWLEEHESLPALAEALPEKYDLLKGKLYLEAKDRDSARKWLRHCLRRLEGLPQTAATQRKIEEVHFLMYG